MDVSEAIQHANSILPGHAVADGKEDPRWQAIITVGEFVESHPEIVWAFVERWGKHPNKDLRAAIATCLLEHLLEFHFALVFPLVERLAQTSKRFADTFSICGKFGQSETPGNSAKFDRLRRAIRKSKWV